MSIKVRIPGEVLQTYTGGRDVVEVNGNTVGECLEDVVKQFPSKKQWLFLKRGESLFREIIVLVNGENPYPTGLDKPVKDGDEISLMLAMFGG